MRWAHIYCLFCPIDNEPFYIGATVGDLEKRLREHVLESEKYDTEKGLKCLKEKKKKIRFILSNGVAPKILVIDTVPLPQSQIKEKEYYDKVQSLGFKLLQSPTRFNHHSSIKHK